MSKVVNKHIGFVLLGGITLLLTWVSRNNIFFWDTIQFAGRHGHWFFDNGLQLLPPDMDSGHPPTFGLYIAGMWKLFGRSLAVSHFSLLPFLLANIYLAISIGEKVLGEKKGYLFGLSLLCYPFYLGHSILVSPDIILATGLLLFILGSIRKKRSIMIAGGIILGLISMRGFFVLGCLGLYQLSQSWTREKSFIGNLQEVIFITLPGVAFFLFYQWLHYSQTAWVGFHSDSPWSEAFGLVELKNLFRNFVVFCWRLMDFGMIILIGVLLLYWKQAKKSTYRLWLLLLLLLIGFMFLLMPFSGLLNHRYFQPVHIVGLFIMLTFIKDKWWVYGVLAVMLTGNLWIYPDTLSQGWDSTAAHWPIYKMEKEMYTYISGRADINSNEVGTAFPFYDNRKFLDPADTTSGYKRVAYDMDKFILYSNVMNSYTDAQISAMDTDFKAIKILEKRGVKLKLLERINNERINNQD